MMLGKRPLVFLTGVGLAGFIATAALSACSVTVGELPDDDGGITPRPDTGTTTGGDSGSDVSRPPVNEACNSCLFQTCTGQHSLCQQNQECAKVYACATKTGCDGNCVRACMDAYPNGADAYLALATCDRDNTCTTCSTQCSAEKAVTDCAPVVVIDAGSPTDDAGTTSDASTPQNACSACISSACSAQDQACTTGSKCEEFNTCATAEGPSIKPPSAMPAKAIRRGQLGSVKSAPMPPSTARRTRGSRANIRAAIIEPRE